MKTLVDNSLLHLYITITETTRLVPVHKRNGILVRYLKPMLKDSRYRRVKNELRSLLSTGRSPKGNLEAQLLDIRDIGLNVEKNASDTQNLFTLLESLRCKQGLDSRIIASEKERMIPDMIYMLREHIENGFNDAGEQLTLLSLLLPSEKISDAIEEIELTGFFKPLMEHIDRDTQQGHILLHPMRDVSNHIG